MELLHAAGESTRTSRCTEDQFSQPSRVLLDPASAKVVDLGQKLMMHAVCAIADIVSACGKHTRLLMQCASLRTCRLWSIQPSLKLAMSSEVVCTHCAWWNATLRRFFSCQSVRCSQCDLVVCSIHQASICDWQVENNVD